MRRMSSDFCNKRIFNILSILFYSLGFIWSYVDWICPTWGYIGFINDPSLNDNYFHLSITTIFCIIPSLWMPLKINRPSMIIYWLLYLMTYIPMIIGVNLSVFFTLYQMYTFDIFAMISIGLTGISYKIKLISIGTLLVSRKAFWTFFFVITVLFLFYTLYIFRNSLTLVNFLSSSSADLYDFRFSGRDIESQNPLVGYIILWMSGAFFPFAFGYGLVYKRTLFVLIGVIGQILLYMTMANKAFILSILFMWLILWILKKRIPFGTLFSLILFFLTALTTISQVYFQDFFPIIFFPLSSLFLVRTIGTSALTANLYYDFFNNNPFTYYSHVSFINKVISYPYGDETIGVVIGNFYTSISRYNINANMYITDGITALGLIGMPIVSILCCMLFYVIDSFARRQNILFTSILLSYAGLNMMNVSLFTSIISGGIFLTVFFLFFFKPSILE